MESIQTYPQSNNLFKFREFNENHIKALVDNQLWFSTGDCFNDPFDCSVNLPMIWASEDSLLQYVIHNTEITTLLLDNGKTQNQVKNVIDKLLEMIMKNPEHVHDRSMDVYRSLLVDHMGKLLILCLCQDVTNNLMWSHYAAHHTGFCIEFNREKLFNATDLYHHAEVNYKSQPYDILKNLKRKGDNRPHPVTQACFIKSPEWNYENEYRLIHKDTSSYLETKYSKPVEYEPNCVESIYFGMNAKQDDIEKLCEELKGREISFYKMRPDSEGTTFDMEIISLK